ncbi:hypothetical protein BDQ17DRAFT_107416 [Cyathus striatus]|nr:hypothetical protein BDQ17DRAFT_107416 [Cyathus striatus]
MLFGILNNDVPALPSNLLSALALSDYSEPLPQPALSTRDMHVQDSRRDTSPFRVAEMAVELQVERMRLEEAIYARDIALGHLEKACSALKEKKEIIERYERGAAPVCSSRARDAGQLQDATVQATIRDQSATGAPPLDLLEQVLVGRV